MVQGYPHWPSVSPGDTLTLHVSTDQPQFSIDFYRQGQTLAIMGNLPVQYGYNIPQGSPDVDWGWPSYDFQIPDDWHSGAYIAIFIQVDENGNDIPDPQSDANT